MKDFAKPALVAEAASFGRPIGRIPQAGNLSDEFLRPPLGAASMQAVDVETLKQQPAVIAALDAAWKDSLPDDPDGRHEEGGWIYQHAVDGAIETRRANTGATSTINLDDPPVVAGAVVVATFHTHPHPSREGWYTGPSAADIDSANYLGVPCIIRADDGLHATGPRSRRGGLMGPPGYPH